MLFEKQDYQEKCISNIIQVLSNDCDVINNDYSNLKNAIKEIYEENSYKEFSLHSDITKPKLDIIMETGTGKTFTYIKAIFEINKKFGKNKFIIVVPRNAIKLGVIQNINLTKEYFFNEYKKHLNIIEYPKDGRAKVENDFLNNPNNLSILVLTNSSFNSKKNIINQLPEKGNLFKNGTIWENIAAQNPIIIIDEPHLLKGNKTTEYFDKLKSLFIRFGATYPTEKQHALSNVVYSLDSITSFNEYLVKRIRVNTILTDAEHGNHQLSKIESKNNRFTMAYFINQNNKTATIGLKEDIGSKTGIPSFNGVHATKITAEKVFLSNHDILTLEKNINLSDDEMRFMIRRTIDKHFEKEEHLFNKDIKTLSLFFIPSVASFRGDAPIIKQIFEEEYIKARDIIYNNTTNAEYKEFLDDDFVDGKLRVHQGYFSGDKGGTKDDRESKEIDVILSDKEKLLSFDGELSNLRFVFSVWALQEGWDNPNIFNICKLSSTDKETTRRQQVGRGLRIAVNDQGKRLTYKHLEENEQAFYEINTLDMIVSHYELDFIDNIQREIQQASFSIAGDIINTAILMEQKINERDALRLLLLLEDKEIITFCEVENTYKIKASISDFITANKSLILNEIKSIDENKLQAIKAIFKNNAPAVINGNKSSITVKIRQNKLKEFKQLWEVINRKSKIIYRDINEDTVINAIACAFNNENIPPMENKVIEKAYNSQLNQIETKYNKSLGTNTEFFKDNTYREFVNIFVKDRKLNVTLKFMTKLLNQIDMQKIKNNPSRATNFLKMQIKDQIHTSLLQKIDYAFESEVNITSLQDAKGVYLKEINHTLLGRYVSDKAAPDNLLYDSVVFDSKIEEHIQLNDPQAIGDSKITVFAKMPKISIPTPYKNYNPDFAYLVSKPNGKPLFLVVEAKGYNSESEIPEDEKRKIDYAKRFFTRLQKELPDIEIAFKTRVNTTELSQILTDIEQGN